MTEQRVHLAKSAMSIYRSLDEFSQEVGRVCREYGIDDRLKELVQLHCSQLNGCAYCMRVHVERSAAAGITMDELGQIATWRESGVFSDRERAALELAESHTFIHRGGVPDDVYERVGSILTEQEYVGVSWLSISINAFNRLTIAGRYPVPPRNSGD